MGFSEFEVGYDESLKTVFDWPTKTPVTMCDCEPRVVGLLVLVQLRHTLYEWSHYSGYLVGEGCNEWSLL